MSVCLLDTTVTCAKAAKPIEMSFTLWTRVGASNHVLGESPNAFRKKGQSQNSPSLRCDLSPFVKIIWPFVNNYCTATVGSVAERLACWTQAQKGPGSNRSRDAVG